MEIVQPGGSGSGTALTVTDGITPVLNVSTIDFTSGATVTSGGAGQANVAISGGSGSPGGSNTQLQYNNSGAFGGITGAITNGTFVTLTTPVLGVASATSINKITFTTPATGSTLTLIDGKTLTINKTISFTAADDTGVYTLPTGTKTLLATDGAGTSLTGIPYTITGTANQVVASAGTGNITLSLPQSIGTASSPQFATIELGAASDTTLSRVSAGVIAVEGSTVVVNASSPTLGTITTTGTIELGNASDTTIARASAGVASVEGNNIVVNTSSPTLGTITTTGTIELGNASDTTVARASAGVISVEGVVIPSISSTSTLTNKRITSRLVTVNAPGGTPTTNTDNDDIAAFTGLNAAITSMTTNLSGSPVTGDYIMFQFTDNGTARAITWGASFAATTIPLPTSTVISTLLRVGFQWDGSVWRCIAVA